MTLVCLGWEVVRVMRGDNIADRPGINHWQSIQVGDLLLADQKTRDRGSRSREKKEKKKRKERKKQKKEESGRIKYEPKDDP